MGYWHYPRHAYLDRTSCGSTSLNALVLTTAGRDHDVLHGEHVVIATGLFGNAFYQNGEAGDIIQANGVWIDSQDVVSGTNRPLFSGFSDDTNSVYLREVLLTTTSMGGLHTDTGHYNNSEDAYAIGGGQIITAGNATDKVLGVNTATFRSNGYLRDLAPAGMCGDTYAEVASMAVRPVFPVLSAARDGSIVTVEWLAPTAEGLTWQAIGSVEPPLPSAPADVAVPASDGKLQLDSDHRVWFRVVDDATGLSSVWLLACARLDTP
jgi:hypothetical protein